MLVILLFKNGGFWVGAKIQADHPGPGPWGPGPGATTTNLSPCLDGFLFNVLLSHTCIEYIYRLYMYIYIYMCGHVPLRLRYRLDGEADGRRTVGGRRRTNSGRRTDGRQTADGRRTAGGWTADRQRAADGRRTDGGQTADKQRVAGG